jgi:hypothetical protein
MKPNFFKILETCIEEGLSRGFDRAYKHEENPNKNTVLDKQIQAVMEEIFLWFEFDTDNHWGQ